MEKDWKELLRERYFNQFGCNPPVIIDYPEDPAMRKRLGKVFATYTEQPEFKKNVAKAKRAINRKK